MRLVIPVCVLVSVLGCQPAGDVPQTSDGAMTPEFLDPLIVDSDHYTLEFENNYVRVLRERLPGGVEGAIHSHRDRVSVYLNQADVTIVPREGDPVDATLMAGSTSWGDATTHKGIAQDDLENLSIELEDLGGAAIPLPEPDAVAVDPDHHIVDFENERVRVVRMTYPPGSKTPLHAHRQGFGVFLSDAHGRNIPETGEPIPIDATAGSTFWTTGLPVHVTENLSDADLVVLLVEMKQQPEGGS